MESSALNVERSGAAGRAVFLSYASQDAEAAKRIADALRAAGIEVWFDQNELVGGDAWDAKIRKQIGNCALFVPVISATTQARAEGYFRLEWNLADRRTQLMGRAKAFLLPVCIDDTKDADADVPDSFTAVQWTRLPGGETSAAFTARVKKLLGGDSGRDRRNPAQSAEAGSRDPALQQKRRRWLVPVIVGVMVLVALAAWRSWRPSGDGTAASPELMRIRQLADQGSASREDLALALSMARRLTKEQPDHAPGWAWQSVVQSLQNLRGYDVSAGALEEARRAADHALSIDRQSADAALAMGLHLANMVSDGGNVDAAEAYLRRAASSSNPDLARIGLAILYREAWRLDDVARECEAVLQANPGHQLAAYYLGGVRAWQRRPEEAARLRGMAMTGEGLLGVRATVGYALAVFSSKGDMQEVRRLLNSLEPTARLDARAVVASWQAGYWERNGDIALRALGSFSDAYVFDSYFYGPKATLVGLAHRLAGRAEAARVQFEEAERLARERLARDPADEMVRLRLAQALALLGRGPEARRELQAAESAIAARPVSLGRVVQRGVIGRIYAELGDVEATLPYVRELLLEWNLPAYTPKAFAMDPDWDRVRDDPRVQAIVRQAEGGVKKVAAGEKSVAVLPFANLSGDPAQEYFSDGLTEEILNVLARERDLRVVPRTSAFSFKGRNRPLPEIAQELGVAQVVEGSVQRVGNLVRIRCTVTQISNGFAEALPSFDRDIKDGRDMFALQDDVATAVLRKLLGRNAGAASVAPTKNIAALEAYLRGRKFLAETSPSWPGAVEAFKRAVELDPSFALAWANLGRVQVQMHGVGFQSGYLAPARQAIAEALRLQPELPEAHLAHALAIAADGNHLAAAWRELDAAEATQPNNPDIVAARASLALQQGRRPQAVALARRAVDLDPRNGVQMNQLGNALRFEGQYSEAERAFRAAYELLGTSIPLTNIALTRVSSDGDILAAMKILDDVPAELRLANYWRARQGLLYSMGQLKDSLAAGEHVESPNESYPRGALVAARAWEELGNSVAAEKEYLRALALSEKLCLELPELHAGHAMRALALAGLGRKDEALAAAQKALELVPPGENALIAAGGTAYAPIAGYTTQVQVLARFGRVDEALAIIETQVTAGWWRRNYLRLSPDWSFLRSDPRFLAMVEKAPL